MIAFATAIADPEAYRRYARPGIDRASEPDSAIVALAALGTAPRSLNLVLDHAARLAGLEALVVVDDRTEILAPDLCRRVRAALADPDVAIAGAAGAGDVRSVAWWEGRVSAGRVLHRYTEHGGGELDAFGWARPEPAPADVDMVAGFLLVLSPWAVGELRCDEELHLSAGYDVDLGRRARAAGRRVITADLPVALHRPLELVEDVELWTEAHVAAARRWEPEDQDWKARARRAEAERDAARARAYSEAVIGEARLTPLERELEALTGTPSWRLTEPLRLLNAWRRERR